MNYIDFDKKYIWHPFTQEATAQDNINIVKGKDAYLWDENGKKYIDLVSSWWTNCHGHSNEKIANAIYKQALELEHLIFANLTHKPACDLVKKLQKFINPKLSKYFFSDNGSTAIEIALKMTYQYWQNKGDNNRTLFVGMEGNYHGDTVGAMSVGKSCGFYALFERLLFRVDTIPTPYTWFNDKDIEKKEEESLKIAKTLLEKENKNISAFIMESLIQGSSGMRMIRPQFANKICKLFQSYNIPVIFDEVMTGFGRTGTMFGYEQTEIIPDIICLSKALTGGALPMALTIATEDIYKEFYSKNSEKTFLHGHSYTANPICCASAIASIELFEEYKALEKIAKITQIHKEELEKLKQYDFLEKFRCMGLISAFEIKNNDGYGSDFSNKLKEKFFESGLIVRPLGNIIYLLPPYCISEEDLRNSYKKIIKIIKDFIKR